MEARIRSDTQIPVHGGLDYRPNEFLSDQTVNMS